MSTVSVRLAHEGDKQRWNDFVLASEQASFLQTWEWGQVQEKLGVKIWRLIVEDAGEVRATAFVVRRDLPLGQSWLYLPRGPIFHLRSGNGKDVWEALGQELKRIAEEESAMFVRMDPPSSEATEDKSVSRALAALGWRKAEREVQPKHTLLLDLAKPEEELLAAMKSKTRYNIRLAERKGVTVRFSSAPEDVEKFLQLTRQVQTRSGFYFHPDEYYRSILTVIPGPDPESTPGPVRDDIRSELAIAEHEGQALAAHLMVYSGSIATYAHGASSNEKRELMAPTLLYWETIKRAQQLGCTTYDFFGVSPQSSGDARAAGQAPHPWAGVTRIKEGFGGRREEYIGAYDLILNNPLYHAFTIGRKIYNVIR